MFRPKKYPLPTGMAEFEVWSERILGKIKFKATRESLKYVLADQITRVPEGISHLADEHFVAILHRYAANQIAIAKRGEIYEAKKAREAAEKVVPENVVTI